MIGLMYLFKYDQKLWRRVSEDLFNDPLYLHI